MVAKERVRDSNGRIRWKCKCDCGNIVNVSSTTLKKGVTQSCGKCSYNKFKFKDNYVIGYTTNNEPFLFDKTEYDRVSKHTWRLNRHGYPVSTINKKTITLSKFILQYYDNTYYIDHINGDTTNNLKKNLRLCTPQQNDFNQKIRRNNTSGITGVWYDKSRNKWCAEIEINNKKAEFKRFDIKDDAIKARVIMEFKYFGEEFRRGQLDETNEIVKAQVKIEQEKLKYKKEIS